MKICPECGIGNPDNAMICRECFSSLASTKITDAGEIADEIFEKQEKHDRITKRIKLALIPLYYLIYLPFAISCAIREPECIIVLILFALCPLGYYMSNFKVETLFRLKHLTCINNLDDVEISDWYYLSSRISSYLFLILGIGMVIYLHFSV